MTQHYKIIIENSVNAFFENKINLESIEKFTDFLLAKNLELNLISRKLTINEIINDHILDCIAGFRYFYPYPTITDLGSGGGFPGILLAIVFPEKKITLVEKSPKKFQFLNDAAKLMNLENISLINDLAEKANIKSDVVTCRAFKDIKTIIEMTKKFFDNSGIYILYKAKIEKINEEINMAKSKFKINYDIKKLDFIKDKERNIVIITKKTN